MKIYVAEASPLIFAFFALDIPQNPNAAGDPQKARRLQSITIDEQTLTLKPIIKKN
jgi:hypothetical protein